MSAMFVHTDVTATTFVQIDDAGLRLIEVDEEPAKRLPTASPFAIEEIALHAQTDVCVPLDAIVEVRGHGSRFVEVITTGGEHHFVVLGDEQQVRELLLALEAVLGFERREEEASAGEVVAAPIASMILSGIGCGILYAVASSRATLALLALVLAAHGAWVVLRVVRRPLVPVLVPQRRQSQRGAEREAPGSQPR